MAERTQHRDTNQAGGPASTGEASPLTGSYLLIVVGEPASTEHKELILQRISKGFLSWDTANNGCDLNSELQLVVNQTPKDEPRTGEHLIQHVTENLVTEVLINAQVNTLRQCVKNLLTSYTRHKHIIHAGYAFSGSGSWVLQDGTFSYLDLLDSLQEGDVQWLFQQYANSISIHVHCAPEGDWASGNLSKEASTKFAQVAINPPDKCSMQPGATNFVAHLSKFLKPQPLGDILEPSDVVGNIRFSRPTLYVFPGGQGDSALFGVNGFNMLVDGGFSRRACFWDFVRHLDRVDALLVTRLNNSNMSGVSSLLQRKAMSEVYPQIGHVFCNLGDGKKSSPDGAKDQDGLVINVVEENQNLIENLKQLNVVPQKCYRDPNLEPVNLYHKVGHGRLDMYVVNPTKDSREVKEFLHQWNAQSQYKSRSKGSEKELTIPLPNLMSICALLVWQPADPADSITRILFPGSSPQSKIFAGLDKLKHLDVLKHSICSENSMATVVQKRLQKMPLKTAKREASPVTKKIEVKSTISKPMMMKKEEKKFVPKVEEKKELRKVEKFEEKKELKKSEKIDVKKSEKIEEKKEVRKEIKKVDEKKDIRRVELKRPLTKKPEVSKTNGVATTKPMTSNKIEVKPKMIKDASNKKAIEAKNIATKAATSAIKKEVTTKKPLPSSPAKKAPLTKKSPSPPSSAKAVIKPVKLPVALPVESKVEDVNIDEQQEEKRSLDEKQSLEEEIRAEKDEIQTLEIEESKSEDTTPPTERIEVTEAAAEVPLMQPVEEKFPTKEQVELELEQEVIRRLSLTDLVAEPFRSMRDEKKKELEETEGKADTAEISQEPETEVVEIVKEEVLSEPGQLEVEPELVRRVSLTDLVAEPFESLKNEKIKENQDIRDLELTDLVSEPLQQLIEQKRRESFEEAVKELTEDVKEKEVKIEKEKEVKIEKEMEVKIEKEMEVKIEKEKEVKIEKENVEKTEEISDKETELVEEAEEQEAAPPKISTAVEAFGADIREALMKTREMMLGGSVYEPETEGDKDKEVEESKIGEVVESVFDELEEDKKPSILETLKDSVENIVDKIKPAAKELKDDVLEAKEEIKTSLKEILPEEKEVSELKVESEIKGVDEMKEAVESKLEETVPEEKDILEVKDSVESKLKSFLPEEKDLVEVKEAVQNKVKEILPEEKDVMEVKESVESKLKSLLPDEKDVLEAKETVEGKIKEMLPEEKDVVEMKESVESKLKSFLPEEKDILDAKDEKESILKKLLPDEKDVIEVKEAMESKLKEILPEENDVVEMKENLESKLKDFLPEEKDVLEMKDAVKAKVKEIIPDEEDVLEVKETIDRKLQEVKEVVESKGTEILQAAKLIDKHDVIEDVEETVENQQEKIVPDEKLKVEKLDKVEKLELEVIGSIQESFKQEKIEVDISLTKDKDEQKETDKEKLVPVAESIPETEVPKETVLSDDQHQPCKTKVVIEKIIEEAPLEAIKLDDKILPKDKEMTEDISKTSEKEIYELVEEKEIDIQDIKVDLKDEEKKPLETYSTTDTLPATEVPSKSLTMLEGVTKEVIKEEIKVAEKKKSEKPTFEVTDQAPVPQETFSEYKREEQVLMETTMPQQKIFIHHEYPKTPDEVADLPTDDEEAPALFKTSDHTYSSDDDIEEENLDIEEEQEQEIYDVKLGALEENVDEEEKEEVVIKHAEQEAPIFTTLSATHAEVVTLSEGTSPTTPLSPRSPTDQLEKVVDVDIVDKEAIEEKVAQDATKLEKVEEKEIIEQMQAPSSKKLELKDDATYDYSHSSQELIHEETTLAFKQDDKHELSSAISQFMKDSDMETTQDTSEEKVDQGGTSDVVLPPVMFGLPEDDEPEEAEDSFIKRKLSAPVDPMTQSFYGEESIFCSAPDEEPEILEKDEIDEKVFDKHLEFDGRSDIPKVTSMSQLEQDQTSTFDVGDSKKPFADDYRPEVKGETEGIKENVYATVDGTTQRLDLMGTKEMKRLEVDLKSDKSDRSDSRSSDASAKMKALSSSSSEDESEVKQVVKTQVIQESTSHITSTVVAMSKDDSLPVSEMATSTPKDLSPKREPSPQAETIPAKADLLEDVETKSISELDVCKDTKHIVAPDVLPTEEQQAAVHLSPVNTSLMTNGHQSSQHMISSGQTQEQIQEEEDDDYTEVKIATSFHSSTETTTITSSTGPTFVETSPMMKNVLGEESPNEGSAARLSDNNQENYKKSLSSSVVMEKSTTGSIPASKVFIESSATYEYAYEKDVERSSEEESYSEQSDDSGKDTVQGDVKGVTTQHFKSEEGVEDIRTISPRIENGSRNGAKPPLVPHGGGQAVEWEEEEEDEAHPRSEWVTEEDADDEDEEDPQKAQPDDGIETRDWPSESKMHQYEEQSSGGSSPQGFEMDSPEVRKTPFGFPQRPTLEERYLPDLKRHEPAHSSASSTQLSTPSSESGVAKDESKKTPLEEWGEPMGLPSPPPVSRDSKNQSPPSSKTGSTPASPRRIIRNNKDMRPRRTESPKPSEDSRRSLPGSKLTSSIKGPTSHYYVDLAYIPHHGNPHYSNVEFFKRVRARYYVLSGINPSKEVLNSLLEAKQSWEDKNLEVTIIPTYDTDTLGYWVAMNEDILTKNKIDLAPSASRCTINLQDHETSCSAYRLEF